MNLKCPPSPSLFSISPEMPCEKLYSDISQNSQKSVLMNKDCSMWILLEMLGSFPEYQFCRTPWCIWHFKCIVMSFKTKCNIKYDVIESCNKCKQIFFCESPIYYNYPQEMCSLKSYPEHLGTYCEVGAFTITEVVTRLFFRILPFLFILISEIHSGSCQTSNIERFLRKVNSF